MARDILCTEQAPPLVPGVQALGDVAKVKSGCVELLGTCILSIDPGGDIPNAKPGATKPVIKSPLNYGRFSKSYSLLSRKCHAYTQFCGNSKMF